MTFKQFSIENRNRCTSADGFNHSLDDWSPSDWFTAVLGELGEAANVQKKLNRVRGDIPGNKGVTEEELTHKLADELADTFIYLDLLCSALGIDLERAVIGKFNAKSAEIGYNRVIPQQ